MPSSWVYVTAVVAVALVILGAFSLNIARQQLSSGERTATITGEVVCLPHKKPFFGLLGGAETLECRFGLHGSDGTHYGLNFLDTRYLDMMAEAVGTRQSFTVTGAMRMPAPYEGLERYDIAGAIDVAGAYASPAKTSLYLFRPSPEAPESSTLHYGSLYIKVKELVGGLTPLTFEQAHYTLGKEGVYHYNGERLDSYGDVRIVVSDSIFKPDGTPLTAEEISADARFYYSSLGGAALILEESGEVMSWNKFHYDNPNKVGEDRILYAVALPVEAQDVGKIESNYEQVRETIGSYKMTDNDFEAFQKEYPHINATRQ